MLVHSRPPVFAQAPLVLVLTLLARPVQGTVEPLDRDKYWGPALSYFFRFHPPPGFSSSLSLIIVYILDLTSELVHFSLP